MTIWHFESKQHTSLLLWRSAKNNFNVTQQGAFVPLLTGNNYFLLDRKHSEPFLPLYSQVLLYDVVIYDPVSKTALDKYVELEVLNRVELSSVNSLNPVGSIKIWSSGNALFISEDLKNKLVENYPGAFNFSEGLSHFAGQHG